MQGMSLDQAKDLVDFDITLHRFYTGMLSFPEHLSIYGPGLESV